MDMIKLNQIEELFLWNRNAKRTPENFTDFS